ncbi:MAG TPA: hypothetical protein VL307_20245 [Chitinophagaceae bacterium]|nr:hypothetical protein [Chitinophagaceae bacterium]
MVEVSTASVVAATAAVVVSSVFTVVAEGFTFSTVTETFGRLAASIACLCGAALCSKEVKSNASFKAKMDATAIEPAARRFVMGLMGMDLVMLVFKLKTTSF